MQKFVVVVHPYLSIAWLILWLCRQAKEYLRTLTAKGLNTEYDLRDIPSQLHGRVGLVVASVLSSTALPP